LPRIPRVGVHCSYSLLVILNRACERLGVEYAENTLDFTYPGIGANLLTMALEGSVFFTLTILLEQKFFIHQIAGLFKTPGGEEEVEFSPNEVSVVCSSYAIQYSSSSKGFRCSSGKEKVEYR